MFTHKMAKQKQINLQLVLVVSGIFFTAFSAAKACFAPFLSIYLRQLGLSAGQVGVAFACKSFLAACTASCVGRFLMSFKMARVLMLLTTILYLGGVLGFTIIPPATISLFEVFCIEIGNTTTSTDVGSLAPILSPTSTVSGESERDNASATLAPSSRYPHTHQTTAGLELTSTVLEVKVSGTAPSVLMGQVSSTDQLLKSPANDEFMRPGAISVQSGGRNQDMWNIHRTPGENHHDNGAQIHENVQPMYESSQRNHLWSDSNRPYQNRHGTAFVSKKRYQSQQPHNDRERGRYHNVKQHPTGKWNAPPNGGDDAFDTWASVQSQPSIKGADDENYGYGDDVLDWLLGREREQPQSRGHGYLKTRMKRDDPVADNLAEGNKSVDKNEDIKTVQNEDGAKDEKSNPSGMISSTFWIALFVVCLAEIFGGPIEYMCDTALYHQLDSIDELDKYRRPTLFASPVFSIMGLVSAVVVDSTSCFLGGHTSHMAIHFYLGAAWIGIVFVVGIIIPLTFNLTNQQEAKYIKSVKLIFSDSHTAVMCITLVVTAVIFSCSDIFLFWLIQDMHGLETTMGVTMAIAHLAELPMSVVFTPWLVQKLGNVWLLSLGTACLGVQNLYYSVLWTPWAAVPIQLLNALSRAAVRGCIIVFLNEASPPGMGKAILGTAHSLELGFGCAVGSMVWGFLYAVLEIKMMFVVASVVSLMWTVVLIICACKLPTKKRFMYSKLLQSEMEMKGAGFGSDSENDEQDWLQDAIIDPEE